MEKILNLLRQYRYGLLILVLGVGLMLIPADKQEKGTSAPSVPISKEVYLEEKLAQILSRMDGVGKVEVMLSFEKGEQTIYEQQEDTTISDSNERYSREPVVITDSDRAEQGLVHQVIPPVYRGAIVVCQGGGSPAVKLAVVEAVSDVTGLTADRITVLKMK